MVALVLDGPNLDIMVMAAVTMVMHIIQDVEQGFTLVQKTQQAHQDLMHEGLGKVLEVLALQVHMEVLEVVEQAQTPIMIVTKVVLVGILVEHKHLILAKVVEAALTLHQQFQIKLF